MSWVQMLDTADGVDVNFNDVNASGDFVQTNIADNISRSVPHTIRLKMQFVDGAANDVVQVYLDGTLIHTGGSWEEYYRQTESNPTRPVDSLMFRTGGTAVPATAGNGWYIDDVTTTTPASAVSGPPGEDGEDGQDGDDGQNGDDGQTRARTARTEHRAPRATPVPAARRARPASPPPAWVRRSRSRSPARA